MLHQNKSCKITLYLREKSSTRGWQHPDYPAPPSFRLYFVLPMLTNNNTARTCGAVQGAFCVWTEPDLKRLLDAGGKSLPGQEGQPVPVSSLFCR